MLPRRHGCHRPVARGCFDGPAIQNRYSAPLAVVTLTTVTVADFTRPLVAGGLVVLTTYAVTSSVRLLVGRGRGHERQDGLPWARAPAGVARLCA